MQWELLVAISSSSLWLLVDPMAELVPHWDGGCLVTPMGGRESRPQLSFGTQYLHIFCSPPSDLGDAEPQSIKRTKQRVEGEGEHLATVAAVESQYTDTETETDTDTDAEEFVSPCQSLFGGQKQKSWKGWKETEENHQRNMWVRSSMFSRILDVIFPAAPRRWHIFRLFGRSLISYFALIFSYFHTL